MLFIDLEGLFAVSHGVGGFVFPLEVALGDFEVEEGGAVVVIFGLADFLFEFFEERSPVFFLEINAFDHGFVVFGHGIASCAAFVGRPWSLLNRGML